VRVRNAECGVPSECLAPKYGIRRTARMQFETAGYKLY
jgi:hypothetical protein